MNGSKFGAESLRELVREANDQNITVLEFHSLVESCACQLIQLENKQIAVMSVKFVNLEMKGEIHARNVMWARMELNCPYLWGDVIEATTNGNKLTN